MRVTSAFSPPTTQPAPALLPDAAGWRPTEPSTRTPPPRSQPRGPLLGHLAAWGRYGIAAVGAAAAAALIITVAAVALPAALGHRSLIVLSGSMAPTLHAGDVVVVKPIPPISLRPGDLTTFTDPADSNRLITHRVVRLRAGSGMVTVETRGDANATAERWSVPEAGRVGLVRYRVPHAGHALHWAHGQTGRLVMLVIPALGLGLRELGRIWGFTRPVRTRPPGSWRTS